MKIDRDAWDKVGGIVEATFVNIVQSNKVPQDFDLDELKSICYLECGCLLGKYKPGAQAVTTYVYENLEKRVIIRMKVERFYDDYEFLTLYFDRKSKYCYETSLYLADDIGLGDIARCIGERLTLREIAVKLGCSLATAMKKIAKLRDSFDINCCREKIDEKKIIAYAMPLLEERMFILGEEQVKKWQQKVFALC